MRVELSANKYYLFTNFLRILMGLGSFKFNPAADFIRFSFFGG